MEQRKQGHGKRGRFLGFWARLNCEDMPVIPAWLVRRNLYDPRRIPYLLVWKSERDGEIKEAVRLKCEMAVGAERVWSAELKRTDETATVLRIVWQTLPRNRGRALLLRCPRCQTPRRQVYGWMWDSVAGWSNRAMRISWRCRACAQLRYSSEGDHLRLTGQLGVMLAAYGKLPRPASWLPYVFTSIDDPRLDKIVTVRNRRGAPR